MRAALAAGALGLAAACAGDPGDGLGGSVQMKWQAPGHAPATPTPAGAKRDTAPAAKRDTAPGAKRDTAPPAKRDTTVAKRDTAPETGVLGSMRGRGAVIWCAGSKLAIVTGVQGDTGVGLVVHPRDSLVPGTYPVLPPDSARTTAPAAAVALRLMSGTAVEGYQGIGGTLTLTEVRGRRLSAKLRAEAQAVGAMKRLELEGELRNLPIQAGGPACPA